MSSPYDKNFDDILSEILTDYQNLDDAPDVSQGSTPWIMGSVLASMCWGLYRFQDYIQKQHFPDTADTDNLDRWGSIYGLSRETDETDAAYLARILNFIRQPYAGGNALDFETWALDEDNSYYTTGGTTYYNDYATIVTITPGAVGIYTIPNDETIIGTATEESLRAATEAYIETVRPLGMLSASVIKSTPSLISPVINIKGDDVDETVLKQAILDGINGDLENNIIGMAPGESLHKSKLIGICLDNGAEYATISVPAIDETTIANDEFFRITGIGNITINYL